MLLCGYCIETCRSHGERIYKGEMIYDLVESEAYDITCEECGEYDDLYDCKIDEG